jgi:hypothetical protein
LKVACRGRHLRSAQQFFKQLFFDGAFLESPDRPPTFNGFHALHAFTSLLFIAVIDI